MNESKSQRRVWVKRWSRIAGSMLLPLALLTPAAADDGRGWAFFEANARGASSVVFSPVGEAITQYVLHPTVALPAALKTECNDLLSQPKARVFVLDILAPAGTVGGSLGLGCQVRSVSQAPAILSNATFNNRLEASPPRPEPFYVGGRQYRVPTLVRESTAVIRHIGGFQLVEFRYRNPRFRLVFFIGDGSATRFRAAAEEYARDRTDIEGDSRYARFVSLHFPQFVAQTVYRFCALRCGGRALPLQSSTLVSMSQHGTGLAYNIPEQGYRHGPPTVFNRTVLKVALNHPFFFAIIDKATALLFVGYIGCPRLNV